MSSRDSNRNHEKLGPDSKSNFIVRQDRFMATGELEIDLGNSQRLRLTNYSLFGLAAMSTEPYSLEVLIPNAKVLFHGEPVAEVALVTKRSSKNANGGYEIGFEALTEALPIDKIHCFKEIYEQLATQRMRAKKYSVLPDEFRLRIADAAYEFKHFQDLAGSFENKVYSSRMEKESTESLVIERLGEEIFELIRTTNWKLQKIMESSEEDTLKTAFQYFREHLGEFIFQSPFTKRSYEKPRGYAGDFEMMRQIYANDSHSINLFGSCVENAVQRHQEPNAVRNRVSYLSDKIVSELKTTNRSLNFLSVACGPAEEVKSVISQVDQETLSRATFWLLDQDEEALKYAQRNIRLASQKAQTTPNIRLLNRGIKQVLMEGLPMKEFDLIYSAGLFDYFTDPVASRAARVLADGLLPGGQMIIGNFNVSAPNWFGMLTLFDWHLILRSEKDLLRLYDVPGCKAQVESEPENVNLFCTVRKGRS